MEDIKAANTRLILSSTGLILFLGGWASFSDAIPISNLGLKLSSLHVAPFILVFFWLFSWQRFFVLSNQSNKPNIDQMITDNVNSSRLIFSVYPPNSFGLPGTVDIHKWGWEHKNIPQNAPADYVSYRRTFLKRCFMFQYVGYDSNGEGRYIHFGPDNPSNNNGCLTPSSLSYWKCIWFELRTLAPRFFDTSVVGFHYFPHIFAWITCIYMLVFPFTP